MTLNDPERRNALPYPI